MLVTDGRSVVLIIEILSSTQFQIMVYKYMKVTGGGEEASTPEARMGFETDWLTFLTLEFIEMVPS